MKTLGIIGAGDLGRQIEHFALTDGHYGKVVFFDDFLDPQQAHDFDFIGRTEAVQDKYEEGLFDELIIAIGYKHLPKKVEFFEKFQGKIPFGTIVHSSCIVDKTAQVGEGTVVYPNCVLDIEVQIGANTLVNISNSVSHHSKVGNHCFLSPRTAIAGFVSIENQCIIGINATIIDNITIGSKTQIGGGTVVIENIEKSGLYVGNPARFIR